MEDIFKPFFILQNKDYLLIVATYFFPADNILPWNLDMKHMFIQS